MSSGSAPKLVNGENRKENVVHGYEHGDRKEDESGAAGSTASSIVVLAGSAGNAAAIAAGAGTTASSAASNAGSDGGGGGDDNGGNGRPADSSGNGDSGSNSGCCVTGLTAGGVVGSVEFRDVNSEPETPEEDHEAFDEQGEDGDELSDTEYRVPCTGTCCVEAPIVLSLAAASNAADATSAAASIIEHDDRTTAAVSAVDCYEDDEEEDREEEDDGNMVAAMNEHLSTTSATSGVRSNTASTASSAGNPAANQNNSCPRNEFENVDEDGKPAAGILSFPCDFDHMYASMTDGGAPAAATATSTLGVSPLRGNEPRQNDLTEVKHLKELLLLHLDLIQQQSEQIVTKDKLLAALRQENETVLFSLPPLESPAAVLSLSSHSDPPLILGYRLPAAASSLSRETRIPKHPRLCSHVSTYAPLPPPRGGSVFPVLVSCPCHWSPEP